MNTKACPCRPYLGARRLHCSEADVVAWALAGLQARKREVVRFVN